VGYQGGDLRGRGHKKGKETRNYLHQRIELKKNRGQKFRMKRPEKEMWCLFYKKEGQV